MATMWRAPATKNKAGAPPQAGESGSGSHPRSPHIHVGTGTHHDEWKHLASDRRLRCLGGVEPPSDSFLVSSLALPSPSPAWAPERKDPHDLRVNPKVQLAQAKRFATGVLEHYNKRKKIKFELLDAKPAISIP